jgi:small GTP-binding protein
MQKSFKVVLLGSAAVGKSSLVKRLKEDIFDNHEESTIGAAFYTKTYLKKNLALPSDVTLDIWDTAGQERYSQLAPMYYRGSDAVISVYDVTCKKSFYKALTWIKETDSQQAYSVLVGNKIDIQDREVSTEMGKKGTVESLGLADLFVETSAKSGENVEDLFKNIATYLVGKNEDNTVERLRLEPTSPAHFSQNKCC